MTTHAASAPFLRFELIFDPAANRLTIAQLDAHSERWYRDHLPRIAALLDGLCGESPKMTTALLEEIRLKFMRLAAESGPVQCRLVTGTITTRYPKALAGAALRGLSSALEN